MKILPVIVLYNQNLFTAKTYRSLLKGSNLSFVVYDNSSAAKHSSEDFSSEIIYVYDKENGGVSKAYNYAASYARDHKFDWLLLLDQDTIFPEDALKKYAAVKQANTQFMLFAPVLRLQDNGKPFSPVKFFLKRSYAAKLEPAKAYSLSKVAPLNSGMLINVDAFFQAGGYDENIALDFADFQFIERFARKYDSFFLMDLFCIQDFSDDEKDIEKLANRFGIFCRSAKHCRKDNLYDSFCYMYIVIRRAVGLTFRTRSSVFLKKLYYEYIA